MRERHTWFAACLTAGLVLCSSAAASAVSFSETAVISGGALQYSGTAANVNQFGAAYGSAYIVGSDASLNQIAIHGANWPTTGVGHITFCNDVPGNVQGMSKAYYVYYAGQGAHNITTFTHVVSATPPLAEGYPSAPISFTNGANVVTNSSSAVFVGSYITDGNSNMVPFVRNGDEVLLTPKCNGTTNVVCAVSTNTVTYTNANAPAVLNAGPFAPLPKSADALIANILFQFDDGGNNTAYIVNPAIAPVVNATACTLAAQLEPSSNSGNVFGKAFWPHIKIVTDGAGNVVTAGCNKPAGTGTYSMKIDYIGYVEPVHHLF